MTALFLLAAVAALAGGAASHPDLHLRHLEALKRSNISDQGLDVCVPGCTTIWSTIYGEATLHNPPPPPPTSAWIPKTTVPVVTTSFTPESLPVETTTILVLPTPQPHTCPTPGTYTFPAQTVTVVDTTTVCAAATTTLPRGTHVLGGVTTVVETSTAVVCPVAAVQTQNGVVTSTVEVTTYVCPTPGTYTIGAVTTVVEVDVTVVAYPVVTSYCPGTYTAPAVVTTVTDVDYVFYCPFSSSAWSTSTAVPESTAPAALSQPTAPAAPSSQPISPPAPSQPTLPAAPSQSTHVEAYTGPLGPGSTITNHWATTYTPYNDDGSCKSADQVISDIELIASSGFRAVRIYSTDCSALPNVGGACEKYSLKLVIGLFIKHDGCTYEAPSVKEQVDALAAWAQWDMVELFVVGNEAVFDHLCTAQQLAALIVDTKARTGYEGPITCAEPTNVWQEPETVAALCPIIDYVGANLHAYFNPQTVPATAGVFVLGQFSILDAVCPGKTAVNLESGWPKNGNCVGDACPGVDNQAIAIASLIAHVGHRTVFFSFTDDLWKLPGSCGCEQSWGCGDLFTSASFYDGM